MDIEKLRTVALDLQKENSKLKESYLLLSSRLSKLVPLIKDQLANWDWDLSDKDVISSFEKSDDDPSENTTVPGGCLMLLTTMNIFRTNVYCCKFCSRDKFLACGCFNGNIIMYRFSTSSRGLKHVVISSWFHVDSNDLRTQGFGDEHKLDKRRRSHRHDIHRQIDPSMETCHWRVCFCHSYRHDGTIGVPFHRERNGVLCSEWVFQTNHFFRSCFFSNPS